jgi:hypothetical protein
MMKLQKGKISEIAIDAGCTRVYASRIINDYKKGKIRQGEIATIVIQSYRKEIKKIKKIYEDREELLSSIE